MGKLGSETLPYISEAAIASVLEWPTLIGAIERAMVAFSAGEVEQPLRQMMAVPGHDAFFATMPSVGEAMAVKVLTYYNENAGTEVPTHQAVILLFDKENGTPLAAMDGRLITEMRTAAASAAAARALAVASPRTVTILGSGVQAKAHADALKTVSPMAEFRLWARNEVRGRAAAGEVGARFVPNPSDAVNGADIVACTTAAKEPVLKGKWLKPGAFVAAVGWNTPDGRELDDAAMANTVVVDSADAARDQAGNIRGSGCPIFAEIGEVFAGTKVVPDGATVIYDTVGIAVMDAAAARLAYDLTRANGIG